MEEKTKNLPSIIYNYWWSNIKIFRGIIYKRTNKINGKVYIGQTIDERRRQLSWNNINKRYSGPKIDRARRKYGVENFDYKVLKEIIVFNDENFLKKELNRLEIYYIQEYKSFNDRFGYNLTLGGVGNGYVIKNKQSYININVVQLSLVGNLIKIWKDVYSIPKELGLKTFNILDCCNGGIKTYKKYIWMFLEDYELFNKDLSLIKRSMYGVIQLSINGDFIKEWKSAREAGNNLNISSSGITRSCRNSNKSILVYGNFRWVFKLDYENNSYLKNLPITEKIKTKKVIQFDIDGNVIKTWNSVKEAATYYKVDDETIRTSAFIPNNSNIKRFYVSAGFRWMYEEDFIKLGISKLDKLPEPKPRKYSKIIQFDIDGKFIKEWKSCIEAANYYKMDRHIIAACCKSPIYDNYYNGSRWAYKDEFDKFIKIPKLKNLPVNNSKKRVYKINIKTNEIVEIYDSIKSVGIKELFYSSDKSDKPGKSSISERIIV